MSYLKAIAVGALAGMRSMAAPALVSHHLANAHAEANGALPHFLAGTSVASGLKALAAGEMLADKTPWIPDRTSTVALLGRATTGALAGAAICSEEGCEPPLGALLGALSAVAATYATYAIRKQLAERLHLPDLLLGLLEDAAVVTAGRRLLEDREAAPEEPAATRGEAPASPASPAAALAGV